jgi:hypothetical protein
MPDKWITVAVVSDTLSAQAIHERLVTEGVEARVRSDTALLGIARQCRIQVPARAEHRAKRVLTEAQFTDAELERLATGDPDDDGRKEKEGGER